MKQLWNKITLTGINLSISKYNKSFNLKDGFYVKRTFIACLGEFYQLLSFWQQVRDDRHRANKIRNESLHQLDIRGSAWSLRQPIFYLARFSEVAAQVFSGFSDVRICQDKKYRLFLGVAKIFIVSTGSSPVFPDCFNLKPPNQFLKIAKNCQPSIKVLLKLPFLQKKFPVE